MTTNPELELAFNYVSQTNRHVFLTGKAGTGKTTFLHRIRREVPKRMAVVAPTGVAAINAHGQTIHSLFQLPFGTIEPGRALERSRKFSKKKINLLRGLDLLVIDEVSMVRADVLDGIDEVLRRFRDSGEPFGGLQLLMIGDLHQLSPVVRDDERETMAKHYASPFFFASQALNRGSTVTIELQKIYRQADPVFVDLLNRVRDNDLNEEELALLNERYLPGFVPSGEAGYITLTSHNYTARQINRERLARLEGAEYTFTAEVEGVFPDSLFPNERQLSFKVGAQVMFNKNDTTNQEYYNGKIGRIVAIEEGVIHVRCPGEDRALAVGEVSWENRKYQLDRRTGGVEEVLVGSYTQHPLRLAWAITIHKSQGLTFERVVIDAADAFAPGQVYVALSRCKTLEGIVLHTPLPRTSVRTDATVRAYSSAAARQVPDGRQLATDIRAYRYHCLRELFTCRHLFRVAGNLRRHLLEYERSLHCDSSLVFEDIFRIIAQDVVLVGQRFGNTLDACESRQLSVDGSELGPRLSAAANYFRQRLQREVQVSLDNLRPLTDNKAVRKKVSEALREVRLAVFVQLRLLDVIPAETAGTPTPVKFSTEAYCRARTLAELDFGRKAIQRGGARESALPVNVQRPELYRELVSWRLALARELEIGAYRIAPNDALKGIAAGLPTSKTELLNVNKIGPKTCEQYGEAMLGIVQNYLKREQLREAAVG